VAVEVAVAVMVVAVAVAADTKKTNFYQEVGRNRHNKIEL